LGEVGKRSQIVQQCTSLENLRNKKPFSPLGEVEKRSQIVQQCTSLENLRSKKPFPLLDEVEKHSQIVQHCTPLENQKNTEVTSRSRKNDSEKRKRCKNAQ